MPPENEATAFIVKIGITVLGVIAGIGAKLASMHKVKPITWVDVLVNSAIAFAAAYFVWAVLETTGHQNLSTVCSVICGRYADDVLTLGWKLMRKILTNLSDEIKDKE